MRYPYEFYLKIDPKTKEISFKDALIDVTDMDFSEIHEWLPYEMGRLYGVIASSHFKKSTDDYSFDASSEEYHFKRGAMDSWDNMKVTKGNNEKVK